MYMKIQISAMVDYGLLQEAKERGLNVSQACNEGLRSQLKMSEYSKMSLEELYKVKEKRDKIKLLKKQLKELENG